MQGAVPFLFLMFAIVAIALSFARYAKASSILENWAIENGYRLIESQRKTFFRGPFFLRTSKTQVVYRIVVEDTSGVRYTGYARVGGWFLGLFSDQVDVQWD
jgi:hypothetical protein